MKTTCLGLALVVLSLGAGCGRSELDLQVEGDEGQVSPSPAGGSVAWTMGSAMGGASGHASVAGQAGNGGQAGHVLVGGASLVPPPGGAAGVGIAGAPTSQGGMRGGTTALPPPGGTRPPVAGSAGGASLTVSRSSGGALRGGTTTSSGGRGGNITSSAGRAGSPGGTLSSASRGGTTGGSIAVGGSSDSSSIACPVPAPGEDLIDDMNDGNRYIPTTNGRAGAWNVSHDTSPDGTMVPANSSSFTMTDTGDACHKKAAYITGSLFVDWGANVWVSLGAPYDASKYRGITFWAKVDIGSSAGLRVSFPDKDTEPAGALCQASVSSGPTACFDHYGKQILLTGEWQKHTVLFSEIAQGRWGRQGTAFDPTTLYEVMFQIPETAKFGLWLDDLAFLRIPDLY